MRKSFICAGLFLVLASVTVAQQPPQQFNNVQSQAWWGPVPPMGGGMITLNNYGLWSLDTANYAAPLVQTELVVWDATKNGGEWVPAPNSVLAQQPTVAGGTYGLANGAPNPGGIVPINYPLPYKKGNTVNVRAVLRGTPLNVPPAQAKPRAVAGNIQTLTMP